MDSVIDLGPFPGSIVRCTDCCLVRPLVHVRIGGLRRRLTRPRYSADNRVHYQPLESAGGGKNIDVFQLFSKKCEYVLRALLCAADDSGTARFRARDICERAGVPESYSRKVFQSLVQGGFLRAVLGPGGGYELRHKPSQITLLEVIHAVDGDLTFGKCLLGRPRCGSTPCLLHNVWGEIRENIVKSLSQLTLSDIAGAPTSEPRRVARPAHRRGRPKAARKTVGRKSIRSAPRKSPIDTR